MRAPIDPAPREATLLGMLHFSRAGLEFLIGLVSRLGLALLLIAIASTVASPQSSSGSGMITGRVIELRTGEPIPFVKVSIVGTILETISRDDGRFVFPDVPAGTYRIQAIYMGYWPVTVEVEVQDGFTTETEISLQETTEVGADGMPVDGAPGLTKVDRPLTDTEVGASVRSTGADEILNRVIPPALASVVEQQTGVIRHRNRIHIRGGRAEETLYVIDGVPIRDLISGESRGGEAVSARAVAQGNVLTGGFDAKYGQALSGIVETTLQEGTEEYHGHLGYTTDALTGDWDVDQVDVQIGGPIPFWGGASGGTSGGASGAARSGTSGAESGGRSRTTGGARSGTGGDATSGANGAIGGANGAIGGANGGSTSGANRGAIGGTSSHATFFLDLAGDLANGHLPAIDDTPTGRLRSGYRDGLFGSSFRYGDFFYPREDNDWRLLFKSSWKPSASHRISLSWLKNLTIDQGFDELDIAEVDDNGNTYPWEWSRRLDHYYTVTEDQSSLSLSWDHAVNASLFQTVKLTRTGTSRLQDVGGKQWDEIDPETDASLPPELDTPFFRDAGEPTAFRDRQIKIWTLDWDWTHLYRRHDLRWGLNMQYEDVRYEAIDVASDGGDAPVLDERDRFHVYPNTGALYLQDRFEIEELSASLGLRYDYWFPGRQVERLYDAAEDGSRPTPPTIDSSSRAAWLSDTHSLFGRRFKGYLAPRLQMSHPIGERSNLYFNYGHFSQRPAYYYVYSNSNATLESLADSSGAEALPRIGNPNLDPAIAVHYELGVEHQLARDKSVEVTVYNKDTYDYPTATTFPRFDQGTDGAEFFVYRNLGYARSRGIEIELRKQRVDHTSWAVSYAYSSAKGKSSDPDALSLVRASGGDAREGSLEGEHLWWNRPHKLASWFTYQIPRGDRGNRILGVTLPSDFKVSAYFMIQSGRAYTPQDAFGNLLDVAYAENGPFDSTIDAAIVKGFRIGSRRFEIALQGWNLLDHRNAIDVDPVTGERWKPGVGALGVDPLDDPASLQLNDLELAEVANVELKVNPDDPRLAGLPLGSPEYEMVYAELEAEAAALVAPGLRRQVMATIHRYSDPSMIAPPRHFRISIGMEW